MLPNTSVLPEGGEKTKRATRAVYAGLVQRPERPEGTAANGAAVEV